MKAISNLVGIYLGFEIKVKQQFCVFFFFQIGYPPSSFARLKHCFLENKLKTLWRKGSIYLFYTIEFEIYKLTGQVEI